MLFMEFPKNKLLQEWNSFNQLNATELHNKINEIIGVNQQNRENALYFSLAILAYSNKAEFSDEVILSIYKKLNNPLIPVTKCLVVIDAINYYRWQDVYSASLERFIFYLTHTKEDLSELASLKKAVKHFVKEGYYEKLTENYPIQWDTWSNEFIPLKHYILRGVRYLKTLL